MHLWLAIFHRALNIGGIRSDGFWEYGAHGWRGRFLLGLPHALVTNSIKTRSNLTSLGLAPGKLFLLPNVIDLNHFDDCQSAPLQISIPENRVVIIAVGRVHPGKRFERFIKALALARQRVPELYGILAGKDDGAMASLRETAHALGLLPDHLLFAGECANVPALLAQANVLLLPSDIEGFPNVLLEAMAGRLPVITTPAGDSPYLVQHGKTGFVVDFENLVGMAQAMIDLARSPALRRNMGEAGRSRVESDYDFGSLRTLALRLFRAIACQQKHLRALEAFRTLEASVKAGSIGHLLPH
jgi:glycosyltransferase involved in cell wall biosynthesis